MFACRPSAIEKYAKDIQYQLCISSLRTAGRIRSNTRQTHRPLASLCMFPCDRSPGHFDAFSVDVPVSVFYFFETHMKRVEHVTSASEKLKCATFQIAGDFVLV